MAVFFIFLNMNFIRIKRINIGVSMLRLAIIGTNWITERFVQAALEVNEFELTAVYSRDT